jgi:pimeloyl-[acyl-carrier protein] methyl ester esterase
MNDLFLSEQGQGLPIVLVHGWGLNSAVWEGVARGLAARAHVLMPDLPGHGRSRAVAFRDLDALAAAVAHRVPGPAVWLGWSLGGLVALTAALHHPESVRKLVLVGTTPKFVQASDWDCAMAPAVLQQFAEGLSADYRSTLQRFLSLQLGTGDNARIALRRLRETLFRHGDPDTDALRTGLAVLRDTDLRPHLGDVSMPTLVMHGTRDTLAPATAAHYVVGRLPAARLQLIEGAGHAPFLSHERSFITSVEGFIHA